MNLTQRIKKHEGFEPKIYDDTRGFKTIGYGFKICDLSTDEIAINGGKIEPMSKKTAEAILDLKLKKLKKAVFAEFDWLKEKPQNVQEVIIEMCYQMGVGAVKRFNTTLHFIRNNELERAYKNGLKSLWAKQTPNRAKEVLNGLLG